ncbi:MAG TPA: peptide deformylase [Ruminiclostridium sp.]|nr:peptide deformylase [Ruminiclostridium sp.]
MALRTIRTVEDEVLRKKCRPVEEVNDRIRELLKDMADTMYYTENGAGLAAPQVGILKRLVVIDMGDGLVNLINPEIMDRKGTQEVIEGCLSIPGKWGKVIRPAEVTVRALNEKGEEVLIKGAKDMAKCLCHEIDHLDGILFIDKVTEYIKD